MNKTTLDEVRVRAPQLPADPALWLNTGGKAVSLADLRGSVVLLDFWTYCCINCLHVLPDLKYLEMKYADRPFVVIGVHSAKFDNEKNADNLRNAILRHDIRHPVLRDDAYDVWGRYSVHAWPTFVLIDPEGYYIGSVSGEGHRDQLDEAIGQLLALYEGEPGMAKKPVFALEMEQTTDQPLYYPGKVLADARTKRLFIADTRHNRIVLCDLDGANHVVIGSGDEGQADGDYQAASFHQPQGMALVGDALYVCDCENHLLRRIDLERQTVTTIAGTGEQGHARTPGGHARRVALSSPWDICHQQNSLYVAMAGTHQIWRYDLTTGNMEPFAGTGREAGIDGTALQAAFAQPGGIATDGTALYIADSEISSIRRITLDAAPIVSTLAGSGDLFGFGDVDGRGDGVLLQHPLGVACYAGRVYIADTFNHKIKECNPITGEVRTLAGTEHAGIANGSGERARFHEPGGLSAAEGLLYVADTNNHAIRIVNIESGKVSLLEIPELCGTSLCFPSRLAASAPAH